MATYRIEGTIVDTKNATRSWEEDTEWDGHNRRSKATGSPHDHQKLHRSKKGRYYLECWSQWQGSTPRAEWQSPESAAAWLLANGHEIPVELLAAAESVSE
jgi:hypothetical protein